MIYVLGGSLTLRYKDKGNLLINSRHRKEYGDPPCAPPRLRWGGADEPEKTATQRHRAGGPGVRWTPGRRPPHRNGGTFGSFGHERTTSQRDVVKNKTTTFSARAGRGSAGALAPANKVIAFRFGTAPAVRRRCGAGRRCRSRCAGCLCRLCTPHAPRSR